MVKRRMGLLAGLVVVAGVLGTGAMVTADNAAAPAATEKPAPAQSDPKKPAAAGATPTTPAAADPAQQPAAGKLQVTELEPGDAGAKNGDMVFVLYTGRLDNGTVFDSTDNHGGRPFRFNLGEGQVIKGWDQGVAGMKIGEKRKLVIPPDLAYGPNGQGPIPANATLTFEVKLVGLIRLPKEEKKPE